MDTQGYLIFHLNLAFSSIAKESRPEVIRTCYHSLLRLIKETGIPVGVEVSGWTLRQIEEIDPAWLKEFKELLETEQCELIGSGYCQIIAPLLPHAVNIWNQRLGLNEYTRILDVRPDIVLTNEMAYSNSLVDLYSQVGYHGFIMDRDNVRLALDLDGLPLTSVPTHAQGISDNTLPILWADSILFQKIQHYAHGDITRGHYLDYLQKRIGEGESLLPLYCNDAEIFDYRPGRFNQERSIAKDGEWNRLIDLLQHIRQETDIKWISPSQALAVSSRSFSPIVKRLTSAAHPIPVKKQVKYNINRWSVSGRNDLWLNTICHRIAKHFSNTANTREKDWQKLCEFWASDYRTHIENKRYQAMLTDLQTFLISHGIQETQAPAPVYKNSRSGFTLQKDKESIFLSVQTSQIKLVLNLRRGLAIKTLAFKSHDFTPFIGSIPHGYFKSIRLGADYYSGHFIAELPTEHSRTTDLEPVNPEFQYTDKTLEISDTIKTKLGSLQKTITIDRDIERISIGYTFHITKQEFISSIRAGIMTFLPEGLGEDVVISTANGGDGDEKFVLKNAFDHSTAASTLVSSSNGLGATNGEILVNTGMNAIRFSWAPDQCACMPLLQHNLCNGKRLLRLFFSLSEVDDTATNDRKLLPFLLQIQPGHLDTKNPRTN